MGLRRRLARWALSRPRVLVVDAPDSRVLRWLVEAELDRRRWSMAHSPADADLLLELGEPGPRLGAAADVLWSQVPGPRHRQDVRDAADLGAQLDGALMLLLQNLDDVPVQDPRTLLEGHEQAVPEDTEHHSDHDEHAGHGDHGDHAGHDAHDEHAGHGDHGDHHMHHGGVVAGLAMASTEPDRDGLELDALRVSLGPVLPGWPTGLVVAGMLQGDVLTGAEVSWVDGQPASLGEVAVSAASLDSLARLLLVAGWPVAARRARAARDAVLSADRATVERGRGAAAALARTVRRSRTLRWSVRGIGVSADGSDVLDRALRWCDSADGRAAGPGAVRLEELSGLVEGQELAAVRLIVASVDVAAAPAHTHHGMRHA